MFDSYAPNMLPVYLAVMALFFAVWTVGLIYHNGYVLGFAAIAVIALACWSTGVVLRGIWSREDA